MGKKIFLELLNTSNAHKLLARQGFNQLDLSDGQPKVFNILYYTEGIVQKDLAKICGVKASTLTTILARIGEAGIYPKGEGPGFWRKESFFNLPDRGR